MGDKVIDLRGGDHAQHPLEVSLKCYFAFPLSSWLYFLSHIWANDTLSFTIVSPVTVNFVMGFMMGFMMGNNVKKESGAATMMAEVKTSGCDGSGWDVNQVGINAVCHVAGKEEMAVAVSTP